MCCDMDPCGLVLWGPGRQKRAQTPSAGSLLPVPQVGQLLREASPASAESAVPTLRESGRSSQLGAAGFLGH